MESIIKYYIQTGFLLFTTSISFSQIANIKEIKEVNPIRKERNIFPLVTIPGNTLATKRINKTLQEDLLYLDSTGYKKSIFEIVWDRENKNNPGWEYTDFEYKLYSSTAHYFCLSVSFVGGKHVETQTEYFLFDNSTGENIKLSKFLTTDGKKWLVKSMINGQRERVKKFLPSLGDSLKKYINPKNEIDSLNSEYYQETYDLYKRCIEETISEFDTDYIDYMVFYIQDNTLFAEGFSCATTWNGQRLDELGEYKFSMHLTELFQYFTPVGKKLFLASAR